MTDLEAGIGGNTSPPRPRTGPAKPQHHPGAEAQGRHPAALIPMPMQTGRCDDRGAPDETATARPSRSLSAFGEPEASLVERLPKLSAGSVITAAVDSSPSQQLADVLRRDRYEMARLSVGGLEPNQQLAGFQQLSCDLMEQLMERGVINSINPH